MKKIIAGIDITDTTEELCYFALDFASKMNAELIFVSVLDDWNVAAVGKISSMGYNVEGNHYSEEVEHNAIDDLKKMISKWDFPDLDKRLILRSGKPAKELLKVIVEENADAVIVGVKTHKDLEHKFETSVSGKIFKKSPIPVISFRPEYYSKKLKKKIH